MATKKAKKEVTLHTEFELGSVTRDQAREYAMHLENMVQGLGWQLMKKILESNCHRIERIIITRADPDTNSKLSEQDLDEYRIQLRQIEHLIEHPHELIKRYKATEKGVEQTYDPYASSTDRRVLRDTEVVRTLTDE